MEREFKIRTNKFLHEISDDTLTFAIDQMKCRTLAVVYFKIHAYDMNDDELLVNGDALYVSKRWVVSGEFHTFFETFTLDSKLSRLIKELSVELCMIRVGINNPLTFTGVRLMNGEYDGVHHESSEADIIHTIEFPNNPYVNLYSSNTTDYLQIIRPYKNLITTSEIKRDKCTILAPHIAGEDNIDNPSNLILEVMNQEEQETNIFNAGFKV